MTTDVASFSRQRMVLAAFLVAAPIVTFFAILLHFAINVPLMDDYDAGLDYLNHLTQTHGFWAKFVICMTAQHNEYKTIFGNAVVWIQAAIFGHIDFRLTCFLGNIFVLPIGFLLWKMFLPKHKDMGTRLALFIPVTLILFQLNYVETLNWAMPALQYFPAVACAFAAIYFLMKDTAAFYSVALVMMMLSISASTNGFFVVPVGCLILVNHRRYARLGGWIAATAACIAVYLIRYTVLSSLGHEHHSFFALAFFRLPIFLFGFLGGAAYFPRPTSLLLGLVIALYFGYMVQRGYWRRNPTVSYCVLFLFFTAVAVTWLRSQNGLLGGTSSRYRIYCDLLMIFAWFSFVEEFLQHQRGPLRSNRPFGIVLIASFLLCLSMDVRGVVYLREIDRGLNKGMALYEHPQPMQPTGPVLPMTNQPAFYDTWDIHARDVMNTSIQLGIYHPPSYEAGQTSASGF